MELSTKEERKIREVFRYKGRIPKSTSCLAWYLDPEKMNGLCIYGGPKVKHLARQTIPNKASYEHLGRFKVDGEGYVELMAKIDAL